MERRRSIVGDTFGKLTSLSNRHSPNGARVGSQQQQQELGCPHWDPTQATPRIWRFIATPPKRRLVERSQTTERSVASLSLARHCMCFPLLDSPPPSARTLASINAVGVYPRPPMPEVSPAEAYLVPGGPGDERSLRVGNSVAPPVPALKSASSAPPKLATPAKAQPSLVVSSNKPIKLAPPRGPPQQPATPAARTAQQPGSRSRSPSPPPANVLVAPDRAATAAADTPATPSSTTPAAPMTEAELRTKLRPVFDKFDGELSRRTLALLILTCSPSRLISLSDTHASPLVASVCECAVDSSGSVSTAEMRAILSAMKVEMSDEVRRIRTRLHTLLHTRLRTLLHTLLHTRLRPGHCSNVVQHRHAWISPCMDIDTASQSRFIPTPPHPIHPLLIPAPSDCAPISSPPPRRSPR